MLSFSIIQNAMIMLYINSISADCPKRQACFENSYSSCENSDLFSSEARCKSKDFMEIKETFVCKPKFQAVAQVSDLCQIVDYFSTTCANKFTFFSYEAIVNLLSPRRPSCNPSLLGIQHWKPSKKHDIETKIYLLLSHVIKTLPPSVFDIYTKYFYSGKYFECFLVLQRLFSPEAKLERCIIETILCKNKAIRKRCPTCISFVDCCTRECSIVEFPNCNPKSRVCLYLPRQVLNFEEFLCTSFYLDELILAELDLFTGCDFRQVFTYLLKIYYRNFYKLTYEARIIFFLRIKFFAFNAIGYSISHLCSGPKIHVRNILIETAQCTNDVFYRTYAIGLGLLK